MIFNGSGSSKGYKNLGGNLNKMEKADFVLYINNNKTAEIIKNRHAGLVDTTQKVKILVQVLAK